MGPSQTSDDPSRYEARAGEKEAAAGYEADAAFRSALFGDEKQARERVAAAIKCPIVPDVQYRAALALAIAGDTIRAGSDGRSCEAFSARHTCKPGRHPHG